MKRKGMIDLISIGLMNAQFVVAVMKWLPHHVEIASKELPDRRAVLRSLQPMLQLLITTAEQCDDVFLTDYVEKLIAESKQAGETFEEPGTPSRSFWAMFRAHSARLTRWVAVALVAQIAGAASIAMVMSGEIALQVAGVALPFSLGVLIAAVRHRKRLSIERGKMDLARRKEQRAYRTRSTLRKEAEPESIDEMLFWAKAIAARDANKLAQATSAWKALLKITPNSPVVRYNLGVDLLALGQVREGLSAIARAVKSEPQLIAHLEAIVPESVLPGTRIDARRPSTLEGTLDA